MQPVDSWVRLARNAVSAGACFTIEGVTFIEGGDGFFVPSQRLQCPAATVVGFEKGWVNSQCVRGIVEGGVKVVGTKPSQTGGEMRLIGLNREGMGQKTTHKKKKI